MKFNSIFKVSFVPKYERICESSIESLQRFVINCDKLFILTGAGISTMSGIPDYRSEEVGLYARSSHRPMMHSEFIASRKARQRYWARNFIGWAKFSSAVPNISHHTLKKWQDRGVLHTLVTQNVDSLHRKAGTADVVELHGASCQVICLQCGHITDRDSLQIRLLAANPAWRPSLPRNHVNHQAPDGDVLLDDKDVVDFNVVNCSQCSSDLLKPHVTFFGDNVPISVVDNTLSRLEQCDKLLVIGSSLTVFSGYRFALRAAKLNMPISIINIGETRADHLTTLKIDSNIGDVLPRIIC